MTAPNRPGQFHDPGDGSQRDDGWVPVAAPGNDLPAAIAGIIHPDQVLSAAEELDRIMGDLGCWTQAWVLAALHAGKPARETGARLPPRSAGLEPWSADAWFSGPHRTVHKNSALLRDIDDLVHRVQALADAFFAETGASPPVPTANCADVLATIKDLNDALRRLLCETWNLLANIDPLTGIGNRNAMLRHLQIERDRHDRNHQPCCVAVIDVDRFKSINDDFGHLAGDIVLRSIAAVLAAGVRPYDVVFRYGGDEFILCLPNTDLRLAWTVVERLRLKIAGWEVPLKTGERITSTVSIGVAPLTKERTIEDTLELADRALYAAKREGRNRLSLITD